MTLEALQLPASDEQWLGWAESYTGGLIADYLTVLARLKDGTARSALEVLELWNDADLAIGDVLAASELLSEVHPRPEVRSLLEARAREAVALETAREQDVELFAVVGALDASELAGDAAAARLLGKILQSFRLAGVQLPAETRARIAELDERINELSQDFSRNARDDVRSVAVTAAQLEGLPADYIAAHPLGADGTATITTDYPDVIPFRTFATDASARRALTHAFENRAWPQNDAVLGELLELRTDYADLLGFPSWAEYDSQRKMTGSAEAIERFIEKVREASDAQAHADYEVLLRRLQAEDRSAAAVDFSSAMHATELVRREQYEVDSQEARPYFDISKVRQGLLDVTGRLFGLSYTAVPDAPVWHPEVYAYDVALLADGEGKGDAAGNPSGVPLGRIFLDLHPREGKFKHAAAFSLRTGLADRQLGEGALVCNFNRGALEHTQVTTLFHEFGHLVHGLVASRQKWAAFSGITTEWDFVEAPSQMLEEWAWDASVLQSFATDETGEPIPAELVGRMRRANAFGRGQWAARQLFYTAVSYFLHQQRPADRTAFVDELQSRYDVLALLPDSHFHASFGHLTGYSSAYYTYLWSLVIAKDLFTAFDREDLFAPEVARRYRDVVLARGGSADAAQLISDFLGRPYAFDAFAAWLAAE